MVTLLRATGLSLLLVALLASCRSVEYFPKGSEGWYEPHLIAMGEPSIYAGVAQGQQVRFLWLRTFHEPVAVRVWAAAQGYRLRAVVLSGKGGYEPGRIADVVERRLSESEWNAVLKKLRAADFMALPSQEDSMGLDGAQWILESNALGKYHMVDRWSDALTPGYREVCLYLLKLAGISVPRDEMY